MIGERLLDLRKDAGLTQDDLAAILNINKHSISSYDRDKSELPDAIKIAIAKHFNVSADYLLGLTDSPSPLCNHEFIVRLPADFPKSLIPEVRHYIQYLNQKPEESSLPVFQFAVVVSHRQAPEKYAISYALHHKR